MQLSLEHINAAFYDNDDARRIILCSTDKCDEWVTVERTYIDVVQEQR